MNGIRTTIRLLAVVLLLAITTTTVVAQRSGKGTQATKTIRGKVVDEDNEAMIGVAVVVPGTATGTNTGVDGQFAINIPASTKELEFSFLGMKPQLITLNSRELINVVLEKDQKEIETVVVTGYGNIAREAYTGSASVIGSSKIGNRAIGSIENVLRGNVAGAIVTSTGQPGEVSDVRLRGIGSMNGSNQPLYVVDGVIWDMDNISGTDMSANNPLNALNPSDIESTTILRDAASASLYGSRGANGVIVITTKQGKDNSRTAVSVTVQGGVSMIARAPDFIDGREFADLWVEGKMHTNIMNSMVEEAESQGGTFNRADLAKELTKLYTDKNKYTYKGRNFNEHQKVAQQQFNALFQMPTGDGSYRKYDYFGDDYNKLPNTDWYDKISRTASYLKVNASLSGGIKSMKYYASLEYMDQQGVILNSQLKREAIRIKLNSDDRKKFINWGLNTYLANSVQTGPMSGGSTYNTPMYAAMRLPSVVPAYLEDGSYNFAFPSNILNSNHNPVASARENENRKPQLNITASGNVRLNLTKWLNLSSVLSVYYLNLQRHTYYDSDFGDGYQYGGKLTERDTHRTKITNTTMLFVDKTFKKRHHLNVSLGFELEDMDYKYNETTVARFLGDDNTNLSNGSVVLDWDGGGYGYSQFSIISKADYSYDSRYYLSASYRQDRSSRFAKENRAGNFWSVSGAWRLSSEDFWEPLSKVVNSFRIKGSYGINGNLPDSYYYMQLYDPNNNMNRPGASLSNLSFKDLTWEKNAIWNVGIDAGLWKNRLRISAEYYWRRTDDLLLDLPISNTSGFETKLQNSPTAGINNSGVEIEINATVLDNKNWTWNLNFNIATLKARYFGLESRFPDEKSRQIVENGFSPNTWWLRPYAGVNPETGQQQYIRYVDGQPEVVTSTTGVEYQTLHKQGIPKFTGGFSTSVAYKGLELSALFSFAGGHYIYDRQGASYTENDGNELSAVSVNQLDRWTPLNTDASAPMRLLGYTSQSRTTRFLIKGDYLKLRNLALAYSLPQKWSRAMSLGNVRVFVQAENLWVLTKMKDYDPELSIDGYRNYDSYPFAVTVTAGLSVNF
ncbi:MAG: SusC/RagA family TonB-linked outer membrane protein [Alistipes sp.]